MLKLTPKTREELRAEALLKQMTLSKYIRKVIEERNADKSQNMILGLVGHMKSSIGCGISIDQGARCWVGKGHELDKDQWTCKACGILQDVCIELERKFLREVKP